MQSKAGGVQGLAPGGGWGGAPVARLLCGAISRVRVAKVGRKKIFYDYPLPSAFDFEVGAMCVDLEIAVKRTLLKWNLCNVMSVKPAALVHLTSRIRVF